MKKKLIREGLGVACLAVAAVMLVRFMAVIILTDEIVDGVDMCLVLWPFIIGVILMTPGERKRISGRVLKHRRERTMKKTLLVTLAVVMIPVFALTIISIIGPVADFNRLVTEQVVKMAVRNLAERYTKGNVYNAPTWEAGVAARSAVYKNQFGEEWFRVLYASIAAAPDFDVDPATASGYWVKQGGNQKTFQQYKNVLYITRLYLKDPARLWDAYSKYKETVAKEIAECGIAEWSVGRLDYVIPFFERKGVNTERDKGVREWVERRRAEGGDELVATWLLCLKDFRSTLAIQQAGM